MTSAIAVHQSGDGNTPPVSGEPLCFLGHSGSRGAVVRPGPGVDAALPASLWHEAGLASDRAFV